MMKKWATGISLAVLGMSLALGMQSAQADNGSVMSTKELVGYCSGNDATLVTCEIYGQAVYDTYLVTRHPKYAKAFICVNQPAPTRKQVIEEYLAWTEANPQYAEQPAADTILRFLAGRFPCGKTTAAK